ncbi:MAG TPA: hypothetical protein VNK23_12140 [Candidatus Dormibacteraeota bacterium]|nr:hypothetical protein [Candidatus Dormibacteraeota bacterium]
MAEYPVMFTLRDTVAGNGFLAGITLTGHALMVKEADDKWWVYGVRPGAIAENGSTPQEAFLRFRNTYKNVLFDAAEGNGNYQKFRDKIERFYSQPDTEEEDRWERAFNAIRNGDVVPDDDFFGSLPKEAPEARPTSLQVTRCDEQAAQRYKSTDNVADYCSLAKAA